MKEEFIKNWMEGSLSADEVEQQGKEVFADDLSAFDTYKKVMNRSAQLSTPEELGKSAAWKKIAAKIEAQEAQNTKEAKVVSLNSNATGFTRKKIISLAASLLFLLTASYFLYFYAPETIIHVPNGKHQLVALPDNSQVTLNANSSLVYVAGKWEDNRQVKLEGEGFFEVAKGSQFDVITPKGTVTVVGTSFNVKSRKEGLEVSCFSGKVKVVHQNQTQQLSKGEATHLTESGSLEKPYEFPIEETATWKSGQFYFKNAPLNQVFDELARQFDVDIQITDITDRRYSGNFDNKDLSTALAIICGPMGLKYTLEGKKVIVK